MYSRSVVLACDRYKHSGLKRVGVLRAGGSAALAMALVAEGTEKPKGRKMRRNQSNPDGAVEIQQVTCIRGGARKDWLVLP